MESTDRTEMGREAGITAVSLPACEAELIGAPDRRLSIVPTGNTFWTLPPGPLRPEPGIEAIFVDEPDHSEVAEVPVSETEIEAIFVEESDIPDLVSVLGRLERAREPVSRAEPAVGGPAASVFGRESLSNFSLGPVAQIDLPEFEAGSEPEICGDVAMRSRPDDVPVRVDVSQPEIVDQHDDVTVVVTVVAIVAFAWLIVRRSHVRRR